jgi:hypothetical protein
MSVDLICTEAASCRFLSSLLLLAAQVVAATAGIVVIIITVMQVSSTCCSPCLIPLFTHHQTSAVATTSSFIRESVNAFTFRENERQKIPTGSQSEEFVCERGDERDW